MADLTTVEQQYADAFEQLFARGPLFDRPIGPNIRKVVEGLAIEFSRADARVAQLLREQSPRTTTELLPEWERELGLPDGCTDPSGSTDARRAAVLARLVARGGQSRAAFIAIAEALGYPITIEEHKVFRVGSRVGDRLNSVDAGWPWAMTVHAPIVTAQFFEAGSSSAGDPIATFENDPLECNFERVRQAHSHVLFAYDQAPHPADYQPWGWYVIPPPLVLQLLFPPFTLIL